MKNYILIILLTGMVCAYPQTTADKYQQAMDAFNSGQYSTAVRLFDDFFGQYNLTDEEFATAKYYYADALLN